MSEGGVAALREEDTCKTKAKTRETANGTTEESCTRWRTLADFQVALDWEGNDYRAKECRIVLCAHVPIMRLLLFLAKDLHDGKLVVR